MPAEMSPDNRPSVVRRLLPRHFRILEMVMAGHSNKTIAETLEMHQDTITAVARSPLFQAELVRMRKEDSVVEMLELDRNAVIGKARSILEQAAEPAANKMVELLETEDPALQFRASGSILDRVFGKADEKQNAPVISLQAEQVQLLVLAMKESDDAQRHEQTANGQAASSPQDGHQDVCPPTEG